MDWRHKAICRDEDPELFFPPVGTSGPAIAQVADAKLVCARCPVTADCLSWALESGQDAGVWGRHERGRASRTEASYRTHPHPEQRLELIRVGVRPDSKKPGHGRVFFVPGNGFADRPPS